MKSWLKTFFRQLFCWHDWQVYRFGDACKKCGLYRDNVWY